MLTIWDNTDGTPTNRLERVKMQDDDSIEIEKLRTEIRQITSEIIRLCASRSEVAKKIGRFKQERGLIIQTPEVEDERIVVDAPDDRHRETSKRGGNPLECRACATPRQRPDREPRAGDCLCRTCTAANLAAAAHDLHGCAGTNDSGDRRLQAVSHCPDLSEWPRQQSDDGQALSESIGIPIQREDRGQGGNRDLVDAQRASERIPLDPLDQRSPPDNDACLRAPQELVTAEGHGVCAVGQCFRRCRFVWQTVLAEVHERAAAQVDHKRYMPLVAQPRDLGFGHARREAHDGVVARMHLYDETGAWADRLGIIVQVDPIRGTDLPQPTARARHDLRYAERAPNLNQLAA